MSKKTDDGTLQTTKQMLDELDALMDRMLSLPVSDGEEMPPANEKPAVLSAKLTLLEAPVQPTFPHASPPPQMARENEVAPPNPPVNPPHFIPPPPSPPTLTNEVTPPSVKPQLEPLLADTGADAAPASPRLSLLPFLWINERFDGVVNVLPGLGTLLRTSSGRGILGFLGIVLSAAALGWLLKDLLGWN